MSANEPDGNSPLGVTATFHEIDGACRAVCLNCAEGITPPHEGRKRLADETTLLCFRCGMVCHLPHRELDRLSRPGMDRLLEDLGGPDGRDLRAALREDIAGPLEQPVGSLAIVHSRGNPLPEIDWPQPRTPRVLQTPPREALWLRDAVERDIHDPDDPALQGQLAAREEASWASAAPLFVMGEGFRLGLEFTRAGDRLFVRVHRDREGVLDNLLAEFHLAPSEVGMLRELLAQAEGGDDDAR